MSSVDPNAWADAAIRVFHSFGWIAPALLALWILAWAWGRRRGGKD